jgi:U4/U6 small nuclear ribonucleoprotein PRP4
LIDSTQEKAQAEHESLLAHFEEKKRKRELALPATDRGVKLKLRSLGEPICLFGEEARDRRERLRELLVNSDSLADSTGAAEASEPAEHRAADGHAADEKVELFYTEGTEELKAARQQIAKFSLPRGGERVRQAKRRRDELEEQLAKAALDGHLWEDHIEQGAISKVHALENRSSQIGDDRPISTCAFCGDGSVVATGSWSGIVKLWDTPGCTIRDGGILRGHTERVTSVAFNPSSGRSVGPGLNNLASSGADRTINLWSLQSESPLHSLKGHFDVVSSVTYHPSSKYLVSTSFDKTWRLWDLETQQSLLVQEGHSRGVYTAACQVDGSLLATSGLDCIARIWCAAPLCPTQMLAVAATLRT